MLISMKSSKMRFKFQIKFQTFFISLEFIFGFYDEKGQAQKSKSNQFLFIHLMSISPWGFYNLLCRPHIIFFWYVKLEWKVEMWIILKKLIRDSGGTAAVVSFKSFSRLVYYSKRNYVMLDAQLGSKRRRLSLSHYNWKKQRTTRKKEFMTCFEFFSSLDSYISPKNLFEIHFSNKFHKQKLTVKFVISFRTTQKNFMRY